MRMVRPTFRLVFASLLAWSVATSVLAAGGDPRVDAACGEGATGVLLCGGHEALCVPDGAGCGIVAVSCCPPCMGDGCPDPDPADCTGVRATCQGCDVCFTASLESTMAPALGPAPLAALTLALVAVGVGILRRRRIA